MDISRKSPLKLDVARVPRAWQASLPREERGARTLEEVAGALVGPAARAAHGANLYEASLAASLPVTAPDAALIPLSAGRGDTAESIILRFRAAHERLYALDRAVLIDAGAASASDDNPYHAVTLPLDTDLRRQGVLLFDAKSPYGVVAESHATELAVGRALLPLAEGLRRPLACRSGKMLVVASPGDTESSLTARFRKFSQVYSDFSAYAFRRRPDLPPLGPLYPDFFG